MIQINNGNTEQSVYLKLDGYSETVTGQVFMTLTNQYSGRRWTTTDDVVTTNGRYQEIHITPPASPNTLEEGLYLFTVENVAQTVLYASRLAFISAVPAFSEVTYKSYNEGDNDAYNVYTP